MLVRKIVFIEGAHGHAPSTNGSLAREIADDLAEMTLDQERRFVTVLLKRGGARYLVPVTALSQLWVIEKPAQPQNQQQGQRR